MKYTVSFFSVVAMFIHSMSGSSVMGADQSVVPVGSELQHFVAIQPEDMTRIVGYLEPISRSKSVRPQAYVLPELLIEGISFRNKSGAIGKVEPGQPPTVDPSSLASISYLVRLSHNMPISDRGKIAVTMSAAGKNSLIPPVPMPPSAPSDNSPAEQQRYGKALQSYEELNRAWVAEFGEYNAQSQQYAWTAALPTDATFSLTFENDKLATVSSEPGASVASGSQYVLTIKSPAPDISVALLSGECQIKMFATFSVASFSIGEIRLDQKSFSSAVSTSIRETIVSASKHSSGFLGMGSTRTSIKTKIKENVENSFSSTVKKSLSIVTKDMDSDALLEAYYRNFATEVSIADAMAAHQAAAEKVSDPTMKALHKRYANILSNKKSTPQESDTLAAIAALSEGDFIGFIANGIRVFDENSQDRTTAIRFQLTTVNKEATQSLEQLALRTVKLSYVQSKKVADAPAIRGPIGFDFTHPQKK